MRKRLPIFFALVIGIALAWLSWSFLRHKGTHEPASAPEPVTGLSGEDEKALRAIISEGSIATTYWYPKGADPHNPHTRYRTVSLSREVQEIYAREPLGTLRCLRAITDRGSATDANKAVAYAFALVGYANEDPVMLIHAHSYALDPDAEDFDKVHPVLPKTNRQRAVEEIDKLIADVEHKQNQHAATKKE